jgi:hypothetical protein
VGDAKTSLRLRFNEFLPDQRFHGVKRLNLRRAAGDPSLIREALALTLMDEAGVPVPKFSFVWVVKNGLPWGLFTLTEQIDKKFLERQFAEDTGALYYLKRAYKEDVLEGETLPQPNLEYLGDSPSAYDPAIYERKTDETGDTVQDLPELIAFMKILDQTPEQSLKSEIERVLDLEGFLRWMAVNVWLSNLDTYYGTADNLYLYRHTDGRWRVIPWDLNQAFANHHGKVCEPDEEACVESTKACHALTTDQQIELDPDHPTCGQPRPLVDRLLAVPEIRDRYHMILKDLMDGVLEKSAVEADLQTLKTQVQSKVQEDPALEYSVEDLQASYERDVIPVNLSEKGFGAALCNDGDDYDLDSLIDGLDPDCASAWDGKEGVGAPDECSDGLDNDGDGWIDGDGKGAGSDPDCRGGRTEGGLTVAPCNDGVDNDGDGKTDADDPECVNATGDESSFMAGDCRDGQDNDGDGWTDAEDPDCAAVLNPSARIPGLIPFIRARDAYLRSVVP